MQHANLLAKAPGIAEKGEQKVATA